jgi:hypothetical protein
MLVLSAAGWYGVNRWQYAVQPRFTATGLITVEAPVTSDPILPAPGAPDVGALALEQRTTAELLKSPGLFGEVLKRQDVRNTQWFQQFQSLPQGQIGTASADLSKSVSIRPLPDTQLISVAASTEDADSAAVIVKALVDEYINGQNEQNRVELSNRVNVLQQASDRYRSQKANVSADVRAKAALLDISADGSSQAMSEVLTDIADLSRTQTELAIQLNTAQTQLDDINNSSAAGKDSAPIQAAADNDPRVLLDIKAIKDLKLQSMATPETSHDAAARIDDQIKYAQQTLDEDTAHARNEIRAEKQSVLNDQIQGLKRSMDSVTAKIDAQKTTQKQLAMTMTDYLVSKEEETAYTDLIKEAKTQLNGITDAAMVRNGSGVRWARPPVKPDMPDVPAASLPPMNVSVPVALVFGLALGIALAPRRAK